jgi:hypothetical protein
MRNIFFTFIRTFFSSPILNKEFKLPQKDHRNYYKRAKTQVEYARTYGQ